MNDFSDHRPDPDALLEEANAQAAKATRGKLKVFFGMSAGVGKTYAMLEEARKRAAEGIDVLVGYAEAHIRPETEAILIGLDILPYKLVEYRGATLKEFDLDAALARRPTICCVDELAHSNAPGMRHPKRWQDINELLDAGINVYTTLNVQHLESVNDLVERITNVRVRETLPDAVFDQADDVELIDIAPDELLERFREGRIYSPQQAARAGKHFFTNGNLLGLRELALRKTADRVDEQMQQHRRDGRVTHVIPSAERILVCVGPSPLSGRLVRSARRLAAGLRAKLIAVSVERPGVTRQSVEAQTSVQANLQLAEEFGAQIVTLTGENIAAEVLAYAVQHNVTKIVVGKPIQSRWKDIIRGSVVDDLIRGSGQIDIYVIRGEETDSDGPSTSGALAVAPARDWPGYIEAGLVVAITTALGWPLYHSFGVDNVNILMLYLLGVLWVATRKERGASILASVLGVVAFDIFFVPPYYTFAVTDRQYLVTFTVMLLTALVISALTSRVRAQADSARRRERRTSALLGLSRDLGQARSTDEIAAATQRHIRDVFGEQSLIQIADAQGKLEIKSTGTTPPPDEKEQSVAQWAFDHDQPAGRGTTTLPSSIATFVPLRGPRGTVGILGVISPSGDGHFSGERRQMIEAFASQASLAVERTRLAEEARIAWEHVEIELVRNTLLSGVSHDLRTPLAGITGAATTLLTQHEGLPADQRQEMLETLVAEAERLERLINNLLDMTRMEAGGLTLKKEWVPIEEVIGASLNHNNRRLAGRPVTTNIADKLPLVLLDPTAIEQVLTNLLENAVEYTPAGSPIEITAAQVGDHVRVSVSDRGGGLPVGKEQRVFEKFFRVAQADGPPRGVGLGLAICRGMVQAHSGSITAANRSGGGACFAFELPIGGTPPVVDATA